jgi:hypothetical protein
MSEDIQFLIYIIILITVILFILWVFFGGGKYESKSLDIFKLPEAKEDQDDTDFEDSICEVISNENDIEEISNNTCEVQPSEIKEESKVSVYIDIPTTIKKLPSYEIEYYQDYIELKKGIKKMEHRTPAESRGEKLCRSVLEKFFEKPFPSVRPDFLVNPKTGKNLELDCYNAELNLALEYNGSQHYNYPNHFHKTQEEFDKQVNHDNTKREICEKAGIYLISVPYWVPHGKIPRFIEYYLPENVQHRRENGIDDDTADQFWDDDNTNIFPQNGYV